MNKFLFSGLVTACFITVGGVAAVQAHEADEAFNNPNCLTADEISRHSGANLARIIGADVSSNLSCVETACAVSASAPSSKQNAIGAGLAQAYNQFASEGDAASAGAIAGGSCTCGGSVSGSFTAGAGNACSVANASEGTYGGQGTVGSLFFINAAGGGGGQAQSLN